MGNDGDKVRLLMIGVEVSLVILTISIVLPYAPRLALALMAMAILGLLLGYKITRHK